MIGTVNKLGAMVMNASGFAVFVLVFMVATGPLPAGAQTVADTFPSPYMNAKNTPLVTIDEGATVGRNTAAYWNLSPDSP